MRRIVGEGPSQVANRDASLAARATKALLLTALAYVIIVASHRGEFWPFSTFSMFSGAGRPWTRALVRQVDEPIARAPVVAPYSLQALPGRPFTVPAPMQNDLSSLVQRADRWTPEERRAIERALSRSGCAGSLMLFRVLGRLTDGAVKPEATALAVVDCQGSEARLRPLSASEAW